MAKRQKKITPHQMGIIKRYYENRKDIGHQALSELVSDLYLETNGNRKLALWKKVETALRNAGAEDKVIKELMAKKDVKILAEYVNGSF